MRKSVKILFVLLSCLCFISVGCSKLRSFLPNKEETKVERYGVFYCWKDAFNRNQKNIYKAPAEKDGGVVGEVKEHEVFKILNEKDFFFEIETQDKIKGWIPKSHTAEVFYDVDYVKEDNKENKDNKEMKKPEDKFKGKPDAVTLYGVSYVENMGMDPRTWFEVAPKLDMDLHESPYEFSKVVAHALAKHRYLITDVADTNVLKFTPRMVFKDGIKPELLAVLDYKVGAFFNNNQVFDNEFSNYLSDYKFENEEHKEKGHTYWIRLKTEDGEGWVKPYNAPARFDNWYKHKEGHPVHKYLAFCLYPKGNNIELLSPYAKVYDQPNGKEVEKILFTRRIMVLEEKDGWKHIMSTWDGAKAWVEAPYAKPAKDRFGLSVKQIDAECEPDREEEPKRELHGFVTGTEVRVRSGPATIYNILGYFEKGEEVKVLDEKDMWLQVQRADESVGWIRGDFLKLQYVDTKKENIISDVPAKAEENKK